MAKKRSARRPAAPATVAVGAGPVSAVFKACLTAALLAVYAGFLAHPINLTASDLGRHLKNGELFFQSGFIADTNLYAYTTPEHPFVNHHWGTGAIFYLVERAMGFSGLSLFFIAVSATTLWLFLRLAARYGGFAPAVLATVAVIPVLVTRHEIRPEMFSYLLSGLFLHLLWDYRQGRRPWGWLFVLPLLQLLWVNLHIYFFIGPLMVGAFLCEALVDLVARNPPQARPQGEPCKVLAAALLATAAASCVNPAGIRGAIYPLLIFRGYEFPVIENYSVPAILGAGFRFLPLVYFLIVFAVLCLSWFYVFIKDRSNLSVGGLLLTLFFSAMAWWSIRNFAMFAFFALSLAAVNLGKPARSARLLQSPLGVAGAAGALAASLVLIQPSYFFAGGRGGFGFGLKEGNLGALEFFRKENLQGPIFNNFDVGGYLIYGLYPRERVFVDNRPEAYPGLFFAGDYFPLLVNDEKWRGSLSAHRFNAIVVSHRGRSAAGENFVVRRMLDPEWAAVFFDKDILILARRHGPNQPVIARHALPRDAVLEKVD